MSTDRRRQDIAAALGTAGGALGLVAGLIQATSGAHIPTWTGAKANPLGLGLLTVLLSLIALASAATLRRRETLTPGRHVSAVIGLLLPAGLCLSTVGRLWYLPGLLLVGAAGFAVTAGEGRELAAVVRVNWLPGLVGALGAFELLMAVSARPMIVLATGVMGGLALVAVPLVAVPGLELRFGSRIYVVLLVVGAVPFAMLTWWSVVTPLLAIFALAIGLASIRSRPSSSERRQGTGAGLCAATTRRTALRTASLARRVGMRYSLISQS